MNRPAPIAAFTVDALRVQIHASREAMGQAAAAAIAEAMRARLAAATRLNMIFAAAPSQNEMLAALATAPGIDWSRLQAYHMDEYLGLPADHPAGFRRYLREHLFEHVPLNPDQLHLIPGESILQPLRTCLGYEEQLRGHPPDIVCAGIGENGHLAFNDPPVADFLDPVLVKVVRLDHECRTQQVHDGCFATIDEVPTHAYTLTIPALFRAPTLAVVVPGPRKAEAVRATLRNPIDEACPATVLRTHRGATLYLDPDSARFVL
jgi:glucosamine-6-phosphate deaminase